MDSFGLEEVQKGETNEWILLGWRRYKRGKLMSGSFRVGGGTKGGRVGGDKKGKLMSGFFWVGGGTKGGN